MAKKYLKKILDAAAEESDAFMQSGKGAGSREKFVVKPQAGMSFPDAEKYPNPDMRHGSGFGDTYGSPSQLVPKNSKTPKQIADFIGQHAAGNHGAELNDFGAGLKIKKPDGMSPNKPIRDQHMHEIPESKPQGGNYMTKGDEFIMKPNGKPNMDNFFKAKGPWVNGPFQKVPNPDNYVMKKPKSKFTMSDDDINVIGFTASAGAGLGGAISQGMDNSYEEFKKSQNSQSSAHSYWTRKKNGK